MNMVKSTPNLWTKEELQKLRAMWDGSSIEDIANALGKRKKQVVQMAYTIRQSYPNALRSKREGYDAVIDDVFGKV